MRVGCPYCIGKNKTTSEFKEELKKINPNIIVLGDYISSSQKILCECIIDGHKWEVKPNSLLNGQGCPVCGKQKSIVNSTKKHSTFVKELYEKNPAIKVLGEYTGVFNKVLVECLECYHKWETTPDSLLHNNRQCPLCLKKKRHDTQVKSNEEFLKQLGLINPNIVPLEEYYNDHTKLKVKCLIHNYIWYSPPNKLLHRKTGCPKCASYNNENKLDDIFKKWDIAYEIQKRFPDCKDRYTLPFDRYLPNFNVLVEYDGEGHYKPIRRGKMTDEDALENLQYIQKHDVIKTKYCEDNNIPLIRIPYWEKDNMEYFLFNKLKLHIKDFDKAISSIAL